jgi:hypothetical protein
MNKHLLFLVFIFLTGSFSSYSQWNTNGTHIYNNNTGNVGVGTSTPSALLDVAKNIAEPIISVSNLGSGGGATYRMYDQLSGADWKFKATITGGFKIRDHAFGLDVIQIEPNSSANAIYINAAGNVGIGDNTPAASLTVGSGDKFQVSGNNGSVTFSDALASIKFPATTSTNNPMIYMFTSGTQNVNRMVIGHSPGFPSWGIEYNDTNDVFHLRSSSARKFSFELSSGHFGIGNENPSFPIDLVGRMRIKSDLNPGNRPGIWFAAQDNDFDRALLGMSEPDSTLGIWSQHMNKWAIEFEVMREPRIGINIPAGSPPRAELHLYHTNFGGSNDGVRIQNEGSNLHYWNLYTSNTTGDFEFYKSGIKRATINQSTGAYTAVSDARLKKNISDLTAVLPAVMTLQAKTYQFIDVADQRYFSGFLAQDLEQVFPEFVFYGGDDQKIYTVNYAGLSVIALKAIQEQQAEIEELKAELQELKEAVAKIRQVSE